MSNNDHAGHRQRLRKRFLHDLDFSNFDKHNILELVLFYALPRVDTNEYAHKLINHFGSFSAVFDAPVEELIKCDGITENGACLIKMFLPVVNAYNQDKFSDRVVLKDDYDVTMLLRRKYLGYEVEVLALICTDNAGRVLSYEEVARGSTDGVDIDMKTICDIILRNRSSRMILVHNHPNGSTRPSVCDISITRRIRQICMGMDVELTDHYIFANNRAISMRKNADYKNLFE